MVCTKCHKTKRLSAFGWKQRGTKRHSWCKLCHSEYAKNHYINNKNDYKIRKLKSQKRLRQDLRVFIANYLTQHPCVDCKESDIVVLDFDHFKNKSCNISYMIQNTASISRLNEEIAKCNVRCANCHRRKTARQQNWFKFGLVVKR